MIGVREKITSLPFVPENNGIATFHFNNENSGSNYVSTRASITEDGQIIARHTAYGGNNFESTKYYEPASNGNSFKTEVTFSSDSTAVLKVSNTVRKAMLYAR